jgi:hypothetical protein
LPIVACGLFPAATIANERDPVSPGVAVEILEGMPDKKQWVSPLPDVTDRFTFPAMAFVDLPRKYTPRGIAADRSNPYVVRAACRVKLPAGDYRFLVRSRGAAKLFVGEKLIVENEFLKASPNGHERVPDEKDREPGLPFLPTSMQEEISDFVTFESDAEHDVRLEAVIGGQQVRAEVGQLAVAIARKGESFRLVASDFPPLQRGGQGGVEAAPDVQSRTDPPQPPLQKGERILFDDDGWRQFAAASREFVRDLNTTARRTVAKGQDGYWSMRHELARRVIAKTGATGGLSASGARSASEIDRLLGVDRTEPCDDWTFLRRVTLDTVGVIPTRAEIKAFMGDVGWPPSADPTAPTTGRPGAPNRQLSGSNRQADRRARVIDRLLADDRWADHWVSYWQDVLAENPGILKPELNNTGPFRWWLHEVFLDNVPMDRFATDLVMMEGSQSYGGTAGFAVATQNDAPMAAKAHIVAKAFLGVEMQCARCHDAPFHPFEQRELFGLAAMLGTKPIKVPKTSSIPQAERARRPLVEVTLEPGATVEPAWPFASFAPGELPDDAGFDSKIIRDPTNPRERLAALLTSPRNERFAQVIVNRLWKRWLGWGLVEPVDDWTSGKPSHPELLAWLGRELISHDYDLKHVARLVLNSRVYQQQPTSVASGGRESPEKRDSDSGATRGADAPRSPGSLSDFVRRRASAEQIVDSLFLAAGKEFRCEELTMDPEGRQRASACPNLGVPKRAWEFTSLSNERDRPALSLPVAQHILDLLVAYGWRDSRPNPLTLRDETLTPLSPAMLANGVVGQRIARLSDDSAITELSLEERPLPDLIREVFLRVLTRPPTDNESQRLVALLSQGYADRKVDAPRKQPRDPKQTPVSWSNHLSPEATILKLEQERLAREGDPPTDRLRPDWRERMEDVLWSLVNSPEFVFVP